MPSTSSINDEDIEAVRKAFRREINRADADERKITGGWVAVAGSGDTREGGSSGSFRWIAEGTTKNALNEVVPNDDQRLMRGVASSSKMLLIALVYRMVHEGYLSLTTRVEDFMPAYAPGPDSEFRILRDLYVSDEQGGALTCLGKDGSERVTVFSANAADKPAWSTPAELASLKERLEPLSRSITLMHLLTHTAGIPSGDFANHFVPAHMKSGFFPLTATSAAESILGVPNSIGIAADQPGEKPYYDGSYLFLNGLVEVAYNHLENGIPVAVGMSDAPGFMDLAQIFERLVAEPLGFRHKVDFVSGKFGDRRLAKRVVPMTNHNEAIYTVTSGASASDDLAEMGVAAADIPHTKFLPYGFNVKDDKFSPMTAFNPYDPNVSPGQKTYQDLTGRFACPTPALMMAIAMLFVNDGEHNGRRLISTQLIRLSKEPQLPPGTPMAVTNSKGAPLAPDAKSVIWGAGAVLTQPFSWLSTDVNVDATDANMATWRDLGVNAVAVSIKFSGVAVISCMNAWPFFMRMTDAPNMLAHGNELQRQFFAINSRLNFLATRSMKIFDTRPRGWIEYGLRGNDPALYAEAA
jgi:CubicO group peptidase (beta-lactamase class C family)